MLTTANIKIPKPAWAILWPKFDFTITLVLLKLRPEDSEDIIKIKLKKMINISVKLNKSKYKVVKKVIVKQEIKMYLISFKIFKSLLSPQLNCGERIMKNKKRIIIGIILIA